MGSVALAGTARTALISTLPGGWLHFTFVSVIYECELMYRWHAQQHFGPRARTQGQCQPAGSTSLCLAKCGAALSSISGAVITTISVPRFPVIISMLAPITRKSERKTPNGPSGQSEPNERWTFGDGGLIELSPNDPGQQCIMTRSLIMARAQRVAGTPAPLTLIGIDCDARRGPVAEIRYGRVL